MKKIMMIGLFLINIGLYGMHNKEQHHKKQIKTAEQLRVEVINQRNECQKNINITHQEIIKKSRPSVTIVEIEENKHNNK